MKCVNCQEKIYEASSYKDWCAPCVHYEKGRVKSEEDPRPPRFKLKIEEWEALNFYYNPSLKCVNCDGVVPHSATEWCNTCAMWEMARFRMSETPTILRAGYPKKDWESIGASLDKVSAPPRVDIKFTTHSGS